MVSVITIQVLVNFVLRNILELRKNSVFLIILAYLTSMVNAEESVNGILTRDTIFPSDRVLDVKITIDPEDWNTICHQRRDFRTALADRRQYHPIDHPYTYVEATVSIDGIGFDRVGIRKKGFIGSQNSTRPSLKIKLNHLDKQGQIDGVTNLTFNNNQQDTSLISQFMGYGLFSAAGLPAPRCAYAHLSVNGQSLGVYSHVERIHRSFLKRNFGTDDGVLYEGAVVDFFEDWSGSFEKKLGKDKIGRPRIKQLIRALQLDNHEIESVMNELIDLNSFYLFWAMEGLLGAWDGYSGNCNNFFVYLNSETNKFHFIPWGADSLFERFSHIKDDRKDPISVKTKGLVAHRLYQLKSGRQHYEHALREILGKYWNEKDLIAETERLEELLKPHLLIYQKSRISVQAQNKTKNKRNKRDFDQSLEQFSESIKKKKGFIRKRRTEIMKEISGGMPEWNTDPELPFLISSMEKAMSFFAGCISGGCIGLSAAILVGWLVDL